MNTQDKVVLKHIFQAKPEVIFKSWTTPSHMERWMDGGCDNAEEVRVSQTKVDLRVGGRFELVMQDKILHSGEYREVNPHHRLVFTWNSPFAKDSLVTVEIKALGDRSELTLTHERLAPEFLAPHNAGWERIFRHLDHVIAQGLMP